MRLISLAVVASLVALATTAPAFAQSGLPDPATTPGAINPAVTQDNISSTICVRGWTRTVRPPRQYTSDLKHRQLQSWWSYGGGRMRDFEEDHLIPLELGGAPADPRNLWPQPRQPANGWGADRKDNLERILNRLVCSSRLPLVFAQRAVVRDWIAAYRQFMPADNKF